MKYIKTRMEQRRLKQQKWRGGECCRGECRNVGFRFCLKHVKRLLCAVPLRLNTESQIGEHVVQVLVQRGFMWIINK